MLKVQTPLEGQKPRLSSRFSWPIGLEALSNGVAGVPQHNGLKVWFNDRPMAGCVRRNALIKSAHP